MEEEMTETLTVPKTKRCSGMVLWIDVDRPMRVCTCHYGSEAK